METRPVVVSARGLHAQIGDQVILQDAAVTLHQGERVGVVGRNGAGKSTLFRILAGTHPPDDGTIELRRELTIDHLPQEVHLQPDRSVREEVRSGADGILRLVHRLETLDPASTEAGELQHRIAERGGWDLDRTIEELASQLKLPPLDRDTSDLSGGEMRRVALARTLLGHPELLLLDEPTNHLDIDTIRWLEGFLQRYQGTILFVTHDRSFLDTIATRVLEVARADLFLHNGNYTDYLVNQAKRQQDAERLERKRQAFVARELEWIRRGPKARTTKSQSRVQRFAEIANQEGFRAERDIDLVIPAAPRLAKRVLELHGVSKSLGGKILFEDLTFAFQPGQKLGVVGPNGCGKTTLLKVILGQVEPDAGTVRQGDLTEFNYVDQHRLRLNDENDVFDEVAEGSETVWLGDHSISVWSYLQRFLFSGERIRTRVGRLSGGERNRVLLAKILKFGGNFLVLDEPTNDLDLSTLRVLEEALLDFSGCVMAISHDRTFLNRICTGILAFEGNGRVVYQEGDYEYYMEKRRQREATHAAATRAAANSPPKTPRAHENAVQRLTWKEERELEGLEERVLDTEAEIEEIEALFSQPDFFRSHGHRSAELTARRDTLTQQLEALYERWAELESRQG